MLVVRKLSLKLAGGGGLGKRKTRVVLRRNLRMAARTNYGPRTFEKLRAMTTDASRVAGKVCHVRKVSYFFPVVSRNLVTGVAGALMFFCCVGKPGIVDRRSRRAWRGRRSAHTTLLRVGSVLK